MTRFEDCLRRGMMDANVAQYGRVIQRMEARELDVSPQYRRERTRLLADPRSWANQRAGTRGKYLSWRLIAVVAALLLLSACGYALVTGQFSQWFSSLGVNPQAPETSEEVLTRTGTAIQQSQTVGDATVTLNAAVWDGNNVWLSFTVESPNIPEEIEQYSHLYAEDCRLILREDQWVESTTYSTRQTCALDGMTPEETENTVQERLAEGPLDSLHFLMPEQREGNTLFFQVADPLPASSFTETTRPELTLHIENLAALPDNGDLNAPGEIFAEGPFDLTFTLEEPILPIHYGGADEEITLGESRKVPMRFTDFQVSALSLTARGEVLAPIDQPKAGEKEDPDKLYLGDLNHANIESSWGLWLEDGSYVDITQMSSGGGGGDSDGTFVIDFRRDYTYPIDPATVTALNIGGTRIELSGLEQMPELMN